MHWQWTPTAATTRASSYPQIRRVAVIGNYLPRQCGIATFTTDLCETLAAKFETVDCFAIPVNDRDEGYDYPPRVRFELWQNDISSYRRAADFLNITDVDVVCLQHEYGIFGGAAGSYILSLLRELRMPVVTTLHTILRQPSPEQRAVLQEIAHRSDCVVVMSRRGAEFLQEIYQVPSEKIEFIPHGIPDVPFVDPNFYKDRFGVEGQLVLLTFGLLSKNKGIETVIEAMKTIRAHYPNVVYIVLGATHPHVRRSEGETYRLSLQRLARACGVERGVIFHDRFVSLEELVEFIGAADIYLTPYLNREQITSGTLAYSLGAGKAIISTPYWYAEELLADGRGVLVPFGDSQAIAQRVIELLNNEVERHAMRKRAYLYGREMIWPTVAGRYMETFERVRQQRMERPRPVFLVKGLDQRPPELPPLNLKHLQLLTDDTGILQHAVFSVPNYSEGYTTDDNARALMVAVLLEQVGGETQELAGRLAARYLAFLWHAFSPQTGRFRNFLSYQRQWLDEVGSEDCHARALAACGFLVGLSEQAELRDLASRLFDQALPATERFTSPRAWAYTLLGVDGYLKRFSGDRAAQTFREMLASRLLELYRHTSQPDWPWFEDRLTYCNALLPHALIVAGRGMGKEDYWQTGLEALQWLMKVQRAEENHFVPIGSNGFYIRGGQRARFDQQPIEAQTTVSACLAAERVTGNSHWRREADMAFEWFLGRNDLKLALYNPTTGGCYDGLHADRVNQNQGAESTLAFLQSLLEIRLVDNASPL
ncbi:MAG: glycosyltransferase family 4 protein [Thermoguttaceae bacterium]|nr:glycosyltransferase family 4 protein [Thermoguttaceae bacterium]MDW8039357.1 glycosyltransferase family 4 protein [Thermoguttaceae bacterium]